MIPLRIKSQGKSQKKPEAVAIRPPGGTQAGDRSSAPCSFDLLANAFPLREIWAFAWGFGGRRPLMSKDAGRRSRLCPMKNHPETPDEAKMRYAGNRSFSDIEKQAKLEAEAKWSVSTPAKKCGVSVSTLERHFLDQMGKSPKAWLTEQRQKPAHELLDHGSPVKEAADQAGYRQASTFSREFKKQNCEIEMCERRDEPVSDQFSQTCSNEVPIRTDPASRRFRVVETC